MMTQQKLSKLKYKEKKTEENTPKLSALWKNAKWLSEKRKTLEEIMAEISPNLVNAVNPHTKKAQ